MDSKICRRCKEEKILSDYNKCKSRKDGFQKNCRDCTKKLRRATRENKAKVEGRVMKPYVEKKFSAITDDELLDHIKRFYSIYKRAPVTSDFENRNNDLPNMKTYYRHFKYNVIGSKVDSWNDILQLAGISPLNHRNFWAAWQYLVEKAALILEGDCLFQYHGFAKDFRPDIYVPSKNKIIDAAISNYTHKHKKSQYQKSITYVDSVEYWCLLKKSKGFNFQSLTYVYSDEIIKRLLSVNEISLANDIKNINTTYNELCENYKKHRKDYCIKKIQEFYFENNLLPKSKDFSHNPKYPSFSNVSDLFGTFNNAIRIAGFIPNEPICKKHR